mmetsp:Transcript_77478/g.185739  ORF Transcript_77478/g.185739 Transcript_77478/m.185739 type:complete len:237 (-) Transcript_77478:3346-4056(-)
MRRVFTSRFTMMKISLLALDMTNASSLQMLMEVTISFVIMPVPLSTLASRGPVRCTFCSSFPCCRAYQCHHRQCRMQSAESCSISRKVCMGTTPLAWSLRKTMPSARKLSASWGHCLNTAQISCRLNLVQASASKTSGLALPLATDTSRRETRCCKSLMRRWKSWASFQVLAEEKSSEKILQSFWRSSSVALSPRDPPANASSLTQSVCPALTASCKGVDFQRSWGEVKARAELMR